MDKYIIVVGNDKLGRKFLAQIPPNNTFFILIDRSTTYKRVWVLLKKRILSIQLLFKMFFANVIRKDYTIPTYSGITTNKELLQHLDTVQPKAVYLFRAGLIINKKVLRTGVPILNIHCAKVPEYGGLGSIDKALNDKAFEQCATLHKVITKIDGGEVLAEEPYQLNPQYSYLQNENIAYDAGIKLLTQTLKKLS